MRIFRAGTSRGRFIPVICGFSLRHLQSAITCGVDNDYGHPHREILALLKKSGIAVYRTDEQDTILASCDGETITWQTGLPSVVEK